MTDSHDNRTFDAADRLIWIVAAASGLATAMIVIAFAFEWL